MALEEEHDLLDVAPVVGPFDGLDAGSLAALDVVQQTGSLERALPFPDLDGAGTEREDAPDEVHRLVDAARGGVRAEVAAAVVGQLARPLDAREVVGQGDLDVGVRLVVLEAHVEARLVALDEVGFQQERLADGVGQRGLDVDHLVDGRFDAQRGRRPARLPVLAHPVAQALGLAHVEDAAAGVLQQVDAGLVRQVLERGREAWGHPGMLARLRGGTCQGRTRAGAPYAQDAGAVSARHGAQARDTGAVSAPAHHRAMPGASTGPADLPAPVRERLARLAPDQRAAATTDPGPVLCVAPAGSGKTTTVVARIAWRVACGVDPASICALTFNRRAAEELQERTDRALGELGLAPRAACAFAPSMPWGGPSSRMLAWMSPGSWSATSCWRSWPAAPCRPTRCAGSTMPSPA